MATLHDRPSHESYDVVIIGGAMMGSSLAWFLSSMPDFQGKILVVEKDASYENCSTSHTNSCIRQQFSTKLNVEISQFGATFIKNLRSFMDDDPEVPLLEIQNYGYLYLAQNEEFANVLRENSEIQKSAGAATRILTPEEIKTQYPFYNVDDLVLGSINTVDEGYWDGITVFDWLRKKARQNGVEYIENEVVGLNKSANGTRVETVQLATGEAISCGDVVNASGPRADVTARMAGLSIPVEPRKRFTWIFSAAQPLDQELPLTIDPSGVHFRQDGKTTYLAGGYSDHDPAVDFDDFTMDHALWEEHIWPVIATRIPQFEAIKITHEWAGHYAYNTFDQNAVIGRHPELTNFVFMNGFSGHGLQQSPAMGRAVAELLCHGAFQTLDLTPFSYERVADNSPLLERAVI